MVQACTVLVQNAGSSGSGFFIDSGYVATCAHVVRGSHRGKLYSYWGRDDLGNLIDYEVVARGFEEDDDVAILSIDQTQYDEGGARTVSDFLSGLEWRVGDLYSGEPILISGYPIDSPEPVLTSGVVSTSPVEKSRRILVSVPIQHGNSGGPCFDADNHIIGLVSSFLGFGTVEVFTGGGKKMEDIPRNYGELVPIEKLWDLSSAQNLKMSWLLNRAKSGDSAESELHSKQGPAEAQ